MRLSRADQSGSVLMLVPAGFLVLMLLGGIAVDSAVAILGQRQLADLTAAAANDAATVGLSNTDFYRSGSLVVDPAAAAAAVCGDVQAAGDRDLHDLRVSIAVAGPVVSVRAVATVDAVFGRHLPGFASRQVSDSATAAAETGPSTPAVSPAALTPISCPTG